MFEKAKAKFNTLSEAFKRDLNATDAQLEKAKANLEHNSNLPEAVKFADLLIEAVPEDSDIKIDFYKKSAKVAVEKTMFSTNSSTIN